MTKRERKYHKEIRSPIFNYFPGLKRVKLRNKYGEPLKKKDLSFWVRSMTRPSGDSMNYKELWDTTGITAAVPGETVTITLTPESHYSNNIKTRKWDSEN